MDGMDYVTKEIILYITKNVKKMFPKETSFRIKNDVKTNTLQN